MTRKQAKQEFWQVSKSSGYTGVFERAFNIKFNDVLKMPYHGSEFDKFIDKIYDEFEAHIEAFQSKYDNGQLQYSKLWDMYSDLKKQLEPKNCVGCKYHNILIEFKPCDMCCNSHDNLYEPKDSK
jgi:hypothetical protein